jgi:hypothetical protein
MPRGGARPNPGPKKGAVYHKKISATLEEMRLLEQRTRAPAAAKLCKEILAESANFCAGMMAYYQPTKDQNGNVVWTQPDQEEKFLRYMDRACLFAARGAPYQSATFKSIIVTPPPEVKPGDGARVINLTVFEGGKAVTTSKVVDDEIIRDEVLDEERRG